MKWPKCGFRFFTQDAPGVEGRRYRICERPWGHWLRKKWMPHQGPVVTIHHVTGPKKGQWE